MVLKYNNNFIVMPLALLTCFFVGTATAKTGENKSVIAKERQLQIDIKNQWNKTYWVFFGNQSQCKISNKIQSFVKVELISNAGESETLKVTILNKREIKEAKAIIETPPWNSEYPKVINTIKMHFFNNVAYLKNEDARFFLNALSNGLTWKFEIGNLNYLISSTSIYSSQSIANYHKCLANLLPVSYKRIKDFNIYFNNDSIKINDKHVTSLLADVVKYVNADKNVKKVLINGYSDKGGEHFFNLQLSKKRAKEVASKLTNLGLSESIMTVKYHGNRNIDEFKETNNKRVNVKVIRESK